MSEQDANEQFGNFDNNESEGYESQSNSDFASGTDGGFESQPSEQQSFGGGNESGQESYGGESQGESYGHDEESGQESFGKDEGQPYGSDPGQESLGDSQSGQAYGNNESQFGSQEQEEGF